MRTCFNFLNLKFITIFIIIIIILNIGSNYLKNNLFENSNYTNEITNTSNFIYENNLDKEENSTNLNIYEKNVDENIKKNLNEWKLEIPKLNLNATIAEGISNEILNKYIGHFEETKKENGNIVLAAHNRGYNVNYFEKIKDLEIGDIVFYTYSGIKKEYIINSKKIIKDTQLEVLEDTKDNRLTLITCVEDKPEYRRCIQAIENKKGERVGNTLK